MAIPNWLHVSQVSGSGDTVITITADTYSELVNRTSSLVVSGITKSVTVPVTQYGISLHVSPTTTQLPWNGGSRYLLVDTTEYWEITNIPAWVTLSATSGTGTVSVKVTASANTSTQLSKSDTMTVSLPNYPTLTETVTLTQDHAPAGNAVLTYTTHSGNILSTVSNAYFSANIYSHTYTNGVGRIEFDGPLYKINDRAFAASRTTANNDLMTLVMPDTVMELGWAVFYNNTGLTSVSLSSALRTIGDSAFYGVNHVAETPGQGWHLTLPESVEYIGQYAFYGSSLREIAGAYSTQVIELGSHAFDNCRTLSKADFYIGGTVIPSYAFFNNGVILSGVVYGIKELNIADTVTGISANAIHCSYLDTLKSYARTAPTLADSGSTNSSISTSVQAVYHYPVGSNYSSWASTLDSNYWTGVADL